MRLENIINRNSFLIFLLIYFFILENDLVISQTEPCSFKHDYSILLKDSKNIVSGISNFNTNDLLKIGVISGVTVLFFSVDKKIQSVAQSNQNSQNKKIFNFDSFYGNEYTAGFTLGIYGVGMLFKNPTIRKTGLKSIEAFAYSGLITTVFKILIGRRRPYGGDNSLFFKPFQKDVRYKSMPSGHTTVSFAVSTVLAKSWDNTIWKIFWYSAAGMVGVSRIYHNAHWASDVFLGGIIGYSVADSIVKTNTHNNNTVIKGVHSFASKNGVGLSLQF